MFFFAGTAVSVVTSCQKSKKNRFCWILRLLFLQNNRVDFLYQSQLAALHVRKTVREILFSVRNRVLTVRNCQKRFKKIQISVCKLYVIRNYGLESKVQSTKLSLLRTISKKSNRFCSFCPNPDHTFATKVILIFTFLEYKIPNSQDLLA